MATKELIKDKFIEFLKENLCYDLFCENIYFDKTFDENFEFIINSSERGKYYLIVSAFIWDDWAFWTDINDK